MNLENYWYKKHPLALLLAPLGWLYCLVAVLRRKAFLGGVLPMHQFPVPVIVVGNITVGGTGKTPLVVWLVEQLRSAGYKPGVVSRGYGGKSHSWPQQVRADSDPAMVGDEPVLLAQRCGCPVAVAPARSSAVRALIEHGGCDAIVSDDGLQHYAMGRVMELAVIDGMRRLGNGRCLPAGPLREPRRRLHDVDFVVCNGLAGRMEYAMKLTGEIACDLNDEQRTCTLQSLRGQSVHAVAGIGNPGRFFSYLRGFGIRVVEHDFPDHHDFTAADLRFEPDLPVLMTEKDAVKCRRLEVKNSWVVPVSARLDERLAPRILALLQERIDAGRMSSAASIDTTER